MSIEYPADYRHDIGPIGTPGPSWEERQSLKRQQRADAHAAQAALEAEQRAQIAAQIAAATADERAQLDTARAALDASAADLAAARQALTAHTSTLSDPGDVAKWAAQKATLQGAVDGLAQLHQRALDAHTLAQQSHAAAVKVAWDAGRRAARLAFDELVESENGAILALYEQWQERRAAAQERVEAAKAALLQWDGVL